MADSTSCNEGRFQTGLLWRSEKIKLPDSRNMALRRLKCFEKRLQHDHGTLKLVQEQIKNYAEKGYIRKLSNDDLLQKHERIWYLPIFTVRNPNKPDKLRIVWDAKAAVEGISLNTALMKGLDLNSSLFGVLLRSRERKICFSGDISEMFHRIKINEEDQHVLRFFWRDCDETRAPDTYVMTVMTFGATCSPFCAQYIKNHNALAFSNEYPRAVNSILKNHYVDDLLESTDTESEALQLAQEIKMIHSKAGFDICKWKSNSAHVMNVLNQDDSSTQESQVNMNPESCAEKILGMWWSLSTDEYLFSFRYNKGNREVLEGIKMPTKRELLKILMSMYDPMGLISCFTVQLKILIQDTWRTKTDWDEVLNNEQQIKWEWWLKQIVDIENVRIPRCFLQNMNNWNNTVTQLHVFTDAGEDCRACVAYLRIYDGNRIECSLIGSKTKVTPIKPRSIPRLELDAAVMGCRYASTVKEQLSIEISETFFWCDSSVVLSWLQNDSKRYSKYVSFRVSEITESSRIRDWKYVPSNLNIADVCTKRDKKRQPLPTELWFSGPTFLYSSEEEWPQQKSRTSVAEEECFTIASSPSKPNLNVYQFTSWKEALKSVGNAYKFIDSLKNRLDTPSNPLSQQTTSEDLRRAQLYLLKSAQLEHFKNEISCLRKQNSLRRTSSIYELSPYLDDDGLLRMRGRIDAATELQFNTKRPLILPRQHYVTNLIVADMHQKFLHQNHEAVVNTLRQSYYIPKLRWILKSIRKSCAVCKIRNVKLVVPEMAPLPKERLSTFTEPFTFTGVDCFGPFYVAVGRKREKRWGVIFTCLTVRCIHLELVANMDADSFILCFRNFMARRGQPRKIFSDNGTNFVKANRIL